MAKRYVPTTHSPTDAAYPAEAEQAAPAPVDPTPPKRTRKPRAPETVSEPAPEPAPVPEPRRARKPRASAIPGQAPASTPGPNGAPRRRQRGRMSLDQSLGGLETAWQTARTVKPSSGFGVVDIPDGTYCAQLTAASLKQGQKEPYMSLEFTIIKGEFEGTSLSKRLNISPRVVNEDTGMTCLDLFSQDIQRMGIVTENMTAASIKEIPDYLFDEEHNEFANPVLSIAVNTTEKNGRTFQNFYLRDMLNDEEIEAWQDQFAEEEEATE